MDQETKKVNLQENGQDRRPPVRYDENGNPIPPKKRPVRYDENGNPIPPKKRPVRYDENGNPIPPKKRPVRYDENGNPIPPKKRPVRYDENGDVIPAKTETATESGYERYKRNEDAVFDRKAHDQEKEMEKKKKGRNIFGKVLLVLQALATVAFMVLVFVVDLLPMKYVAAGGMILLILWVFALIFQNVKGMRVIGKLYSILLIAVLVAGTLYIAKAHSVMDRLTLGQQYTVSDMSVVVLKDSPAQGLQDLDGAYFGVQEMMDRKHTETTLNQLSEKYAQGITEIQYTGVYAQVDGLYAGEVDAIILNEAYREMILETYPDFSSDTRVLEEFTYKEEIKTSDPKKDVNVVVEPFTVFISGNDQYGEVSLANGRADVNILATVNPKTKQILLTTTPRDYYVELPFYDGCWDKLTHAGLYGIDCSMETLENLYDVEIDYYVRVNFSGFSDIVDALDGVEVYSDYAFTTTSGYYFDQGYNYVYGDSALAFVRERYAFAAGDVQRGKNQMAMIQAIVDKIVSPAILTNYMGLMDSLSSCFITDMPRDQIADLVKMQLNDGDSWTIVSNSVAGYGNMRSTYSCGSQLLSVMDADEDAVSQAKEMIDACERGEILTNP